MNRLFLNFEGPSVPYHHDIRKGFRKLEMKMCTPKANASKKNYWLEKSARIYLIF
jgi:hypothetical protein